MTPSQIVWTVHGAPEVEDCELASGHCYVCCGVLSRGKSVQEWLGGNYTDQNRARNPSATHVCEACVFLHARSSPVLGRGPKEGKAHGGNFRNYSHLFEEAWGGVQSTGYANASKGEKPLIREFLARDHRGAWFAAIAASGQKHVVPFAPVNGPSRQGVVLFEEQRVLVPYEQCLVTDMMVLLTSGATKDEIQSGDYQFNAWRRCADLIVAFEGKHALSRHGSWFSLALWLAQRDEETVQKRLSAEKEAQNARRGNKGKAQNANDGGRARDTRRVPRKRASKSVKTLGANPESGSSVSKDHIESGRVDNRALSVSEAPSFAQLDLFCPR